MMLDGVKAGVRAALVVEGIDASSNICQRNQTNRGVEPKAFKVVGKQSGLGFGERAVADPGEFAAENIPKLGPALEPSASIGEFVVSNFRRPQVSAAQLRMHGATGAKCGLIAEK